MSKPIRTRVAPKRRGKNFDNYRVFKGSVVGGTLIRSDAKVGNVQYNLRYASTADTPYLTSTLSRYNALSRMRKPIVDDMVSFFKQDSKIEQAMNNMADEIRKEETKNLQRFHSIIAPYSSLKGEAAADEVVKILNGVYRDGKTLETIMQDTIGDMIKAYYYFLDNQLAKNIEDDLVAAIINESGRVTSSLPERQSINYRNNFDTEEFFNNFNTLLDILSSAEIGVSRMTDAARPMSYMATILARAKGKTKGGGFEQKQFDMLFDKFKEIQTNLENQLNSKMEVNKAMYSQGQLAEMVMAAGMTEILKSYAKTSKDLSSSSKKVSYEIDDTLPEFVTEILADGAAKTKDFKITAGVESITVDAKQLGYKRMADAGGKLYETSMAVDFGEIFNKHIINSNQNEKAVQMYRIIVLNLVAHGEYSLKFEERQILMQAALTDKSFFDKKFLSTNGGSQGYPDLVNINGEVKRFSDVVRKMGGDSFTTKTSGAAVVGTKDTSYDPIELYAQKIRVGKMQRVPGFSEELTTPINMSELVKRIESGYFSGANPRVKFTFKV